LLIYLDIYVTFASTLRLKFACS